MFPVYRLTSLESAEGTAGSSWTLSKDLQDSLVDMSRGKTQQRVQVCCGLSPCFLSLCCVKGYCNSQNTQAVRSRCNESVCPFGGAELLYTPEQRTAAGAAAAGVVRLQQQLASLLDQLDLLLLPASQELQNDISVFPRAPTQVLEESSGGFGILCYHTTPLCHDLSVSVSVSVLGSSVNRS